MSTGKIYLTKQGYDDLKVEYQRLKLEDKPVALERIKQARELDDLEDNQEYEAAREAHNVLEGRLLEIEEIIGSAKIIDGASGKSKIAVGSTVTVGFQDREQTYTIVGSVEANPSQGKVSHESPVGSQLMGLREGDVVKVKLPHTSIEYTVLKIHHKSN